MKNHQFSLPFLAALYDFCTRRPHSPRRQNTIAGISKFSPPSPITVTFLHFSSVNNGEIMLSNQSHCSRADRYSVLCRVNFHDDEKERALMTQTCWQLAASLQNEMVRSSNKFYDRIPYRTDEGVSVEQNR